MWDHWGARCNVGRIVADVALWLVVYLVLVIHLSLLLSSSLCCQSKITLNKNSIHNILRGRKKGDNPCQFITLFWWNIGSLWAVQADKTYNWLFCFEMRKSIYSNTDVCQASHMEFKMGFSTASVSTASCILNRRTQRELIRHSAISCRQLNTVFTSSVSPLLWSVCVWRAPREVVSYSQTYVHTADSAARQ